MADKTFIIKFKSSELPPRSVIASKAEIHGEHLVLTDSEGLLAALFVMDIVESWVVLP